MNATIGSGWTHTLILKTDGSLWGTGRGYQGELGLNPTSNSNLFPRFWMVELNRSILLVAKVAFLLSLMILLGMGKILTENWEMEQPLREIFLFKFGILLC